MIRFFLGIVVAYGILHMGACMGGGGVSEGGGTLAAPRGGAGVIPGGGSGAVPGSGNAVSSDGGGPGGNFVPPSPTGIPSADPTPVGTPDGVSYTLTVLCSDNINRRQLVRVEGALYLNNYFHNQTCWQNCCSNHEVQIRVDAENFSAQTPAATVNGVQGYFVFDNLNLSKNAVIDFYYFKNGLWWPLNLTNGPFCGGGPNLPAPGNLPPPPGNCDLGSPGGGTQT